MKTKRKYILQVRLYSYSLGLYVWTDKYFSDNYILLKKELHHLFSSGYFTNIDLRIIQIENANTRWIII